MSKDKNMKKKKPTLSKKAQEKLAFITGKWNKASLILAILFIISGAICYSLPYDISGEANHGFVLWFLLLFAYPGLEVIALLNTLLGSSDANVMTFLFELRPAVGLMVIDLLTLLVVWLCCRYWWRNSYGANFLRIATNFMFIFVWWGVFQIGMTVLMTLWDGGGMDAIHEPPAAQQTVEVTAMPEELPAQAQ